MDRKEFIRTCGVSCLAMAGFVPLMTACSGTRYVQTMPENDKLKISKQEFLKEKSSRHRRHVIVKTDKLNYPIVLYRVNESEYRALLLRCSHQQMELNVNGDLLSCSAHGSEFDNRGQVIQGPADQPLSGYSISQDQNHIYIHLT